VYYFLFKKNLYKQVLPGNKGLRIMLYLLKNYSFNRIALSGVEIAVSVRKI